MHDLKERLRAAEAKLAVAREALEYIWETSPNVHDSERARQALKELDADRKAAMDELIAMSAEELDND